MVQARRAMWSGELAFGLLRVPVKLYKGVEDNDIKFMEIHDGCNTRVRRKSVCEGGHELADRSEVVKGFQTRDGAVVTFTQAEISAIQVPSSHTVELYRNGSMPDPVMLLDVFWVEPELKAAKAAALLMEAMRRKNVVVYGTITIRTKERPCVLWIRDEQLVLSTLRYEVDVREMPTKAPIDGLDEREIKMAMEFLDYMSRDIPVTDSYRVAIHEAAEKKAAGVSLGTLPPKVMMDKPIDIMEALRESITAAKATKPKPKAKPKAKAKAG